MKYFKDANNKVYAYEIDGSQDAYIEPSFVSISQADADALIASSQPDPRIGMVVTRFQARAAMLNAGMLATVQAHFDDPATPQIDKIAWSDALNFYRLSPLVVSVGGLLGLTDVQLDQLFIDAAKVTI